MNIESYVLPTSNVMIIYEIDPCFHEVTVVRKIVTQSECNLFSLPSLRENSDDLLQYGFLSNVYLESDDERSLVHELFFF